MDFLGKAVGNQGVTEAIGKQAGRAVEAGVKKVLTSKSQEGKNKGAGGAGGAGGGAGGGGGGGGFDVSDVLNFGGGKKDDGEGGGLGNVVGGLFK